LHDTPDDAFEFSVVADDAVITLMLPELACAGKQFVGLPGRVPFEGLENSVERDVISLYANDQMHMIRHNAIREQHVFSAVAMVYRICDDL